MSQNAKAADLKVDDQKTKAAQPMNGADLFIETLKNENVEVMFGYPGGAVLPLYDALYKNLVFIQRNQCA